MSQSTYFVQECPTCGRRAQIRVEHLGRRVVCNHCQAYFNACDHTHGDARLSHGDSSILRRADQLLETVAQSRTRPR